MDREDTRGVEFEAGYSTTGSGSSLREGRLQAGAEGYEGDRGSCQKGQVTQNYKNYSLLFNILHSPLSECIMA